MDGLTQSFETRIDRLIAASDEAAPAPFNRIAFAAALEADRPLMPEELLSLYFHPIYADLSATQRWQLGLLETVNFFSLNIHGERALVAGLEQRLYRERNPWDGYHASRYLQRFIHEENSHSYMLAEFCHRYHGRVMPDIALPIDRSELSAIGEDLLFFGRTLVLEGFLSFLNMQVIKDERLEPTARAVHHAHHGDESRHVAFDRTVLKLIAARHAAEGRDEERARIATQLETYRQLSLRRLASPAIYRAIGLKNGVQLSTEVRTLPQRQALEVRWMESTMSFLDRLGLGVSRAAPEPADVGALS